MKYFLWAFISFFTVAVFANPEWIKGEVVRIDPDKQRIILKHEYIPSIKMAAMTMRFDVSRGIALNQYRPGDRVRFQFKVVDGSLDITRMELVK
jgi:Cu/Ag efflux protein CusF